jgi:hypothetical protein
MIPFRALLELRGSKASSPPMLPQPLLAPLSEALGTEATLPTRRMTNMEAVIELTFERLDIQERAGRHAAIRERAAEMNREMEAEKASEARRRRASPATPGRSVYELRRSLHLIDARISAEDGRR